MTIICFGDSLTAGFQSPTAEHPGGQETPYGRYLQEWLGPSIEIEISGLHGVDLPAVRLAPRDRGLKCAVAVSET